MCHSEKLVFLHRGAALSRSPQVFFVIRNLDTSLDYASPPSLVDKLAGCVQTIKGGASAKMVQSSVY
jgi:hypothetical protein